MKKHKYVHGYSEIENSRLYDQANTLTELLHHDSIFPKNSHILEAGCGVGAQTKILAKKNPHIKITSIDISEQSLLKAKKLADKEKINNVRFFKADIFNLPFINQNFDHIFVCFVLEHLNEPEKALFSLKKALKKNGTITVIEGDHGSTYFHPNSILAQKTIQCLIDIQAQMNGNSLIGRELYPLLNKTGFSNISVSPRMVYVDKSKKELVDGFTRKTFIAMVKGVKEEAIKLKMITEKDWTQGITDLMRTTRKDGTFCYTFFKAKAEK